MEDPQSNYDLLESEINRLSNECFTSVKDIERKPSCNRTNKYAHIIKCITTYAKKGKLQRLVAQKYKSMILELNHKEERVERSKQLSNVVKSLTIDGTFSANSFWKVKRCVYRKPQEICSTVLNRNGDEVFEQASIREAYKEEFSRRLDHRKIDFNLLSYEKRTNEMARLYVEMSSATSTADIQMSELKEVVGQLKKGAPGPDSIPPEFFINIGDGFLSFILKVLNFMKAKSYIPKQWLNTLIKTIFKNKGSTKVLKNHRGIFLTQVLSKIYEGPAKQRKENYG